VLKLLNTLKDNRALAFPTRQEIEYAIQKVSSLILFIKMHIYY
jgi:hypothetical protein